MKKKELLIISVLAVFALIFGGVVGGKEA